jgi:hypothetical protein
MFKNNIGKTLLFLLSLIFVFEVGGMVWVFNSFILVKPPTDTVLLTNFQANKSQYEELLSQFTADRAGDPKDGRIFYYEKADRSNAAYKEKLANLNLIEVSNFGPGIAFVTSQTLLNGSKGLIHITDSDFKNYRAFYIVDSTDNSNQLPRDNDGTSDTFYVPIGDNWYIFYSEFGD